MATIGKQALTVLINNGLLNDFEPKNIKSASYDLRIGTIFKDEVIYSLDNTPLPTHIDISPSEIVTILTLESVKIPLDCVGTVFAINRMSSNGFLILNPGHIDPGYEGPLTICAINLSNKSVSLFLSKSIFTLVISSLDNKLKEGYKSNYDSSKRKEFEIDKYENSFSKLSNSFFDLIYNHKELPEVINKVLNDKKRESRANFFKNITTGSTIMRGVYAFALFVLLILNLLQFKNSNSMEDEFEITENKLTEANILIESLVKVNEDAKTRNEEYRDRLENIENILNKKEK